MFKILIHDIHYTNALSSHHSSSLLLDEEIDEPHEPTIEEIQRQHESRMTAVARADRENQRGRRMQRALESGSAYRYNIKPMSSTG